MVQHGTPGRAAVRGHRDRAVAFSARPGALHSREQDLRIRRVDRQSTDETRRCGERAPRPATIDRLADVTGGGTCNGIDNAAVGGVDHEREDIAFAAAAPGLPWCLPKSGWNPASPGIDALEHPGSGAGVEDRGSLRIDRQHVDARVELESARPTPPAVRAAEHAPATNGVHVRGVLGIDDDRVGAARRPGRDAPASDGLRSGRGPRRRRVSRTRRAYPHPVAPGIGRRQSGEPNQQRRRPIPLPTTSCPPACLLDQRLQLRNTPLEIAILLDLRPARRHGDSHSVFISMTLH